MATTTAYPHLFEISITLTFTASYRKRVIDTAIVYSRLFEFLTTLTFRALHGHKHVPDPYNNSLYLIKLFSSSSPEGSCGGNQQSDGSGLSFCHQNPSITNDLHDLPQWLHDFLLHLQCIFVKIYIYIYMCYHESSRTPQHSKLNCVGANRPQHMHMEGHIVCD